VKLSLQGVFLYPIGVRNAYFFPASFIAGNRKYIVDIVACPESNRGRELPTILLEINPSGGSKMKTYVYANSQILAQHNGNYNAPRFFYLHDRLGSVRLVINGNCVAQSSYTYNSFGEVIESGHESQAPSDDFMFTRQFYDSETGQYYLRARMYDPPLMRFISRDPVDGKFEEPLTLHKYLYCGNDPINRIDPWGLWNYSYNTWETLRIIKDCTNLVGTNPITGPFKAFGKGGKYIFKGENDTMDLFNLRFKDSEFSNYLAGYSCYYNWGFYGDQGVRTMGHVYNWGWDDPGSQFYLSAGILQAFRDRDIELRPHIFGRSFTITQAKVQLYGWGLVLMLDAMVDDQDEESSRILNNIQILWNGGISSNLMQIDNPLDRYSK
jgi:RHS repeat-associated protein